jgi:hypothetical protein
MLSQISDLLHLCHEKHPDIVLVSEYFPKLIEVLKELRTLSRFAVRNSINLLIVPQCDIFNPLTLLNDWGETKKRLMTADIQFEATQIPDKTFIDSIGLWFDSCGTVYAFPKNERVPLHIIPGHEDIIVAICYELEKLDSHHFNGNMARLLLNPAHLGYDDKASIRTLKFADTPHFLIPDSCYLKSIGASLAEKKILAVRCDGANPVHTTGILNSPSGWTIEHLETSERSMFLQLANQI